MSFLAPLFLIGAISVGLPVIFHLIRRASKEQIPFSSLMFLQPTPPRLTKRNRLEHVLLLLLRCLIIALLALGFARPFLQKPLTTPQSAETGRKLIVLIDTSASMRREGLWPMALAKARDFLNKTTPADRVAVFNFDRQIHSLVSFDQWAKMVPAERASMTAQRLNELKPGWASTHLGNALIAAVEAFAEADRQGQNIGRRQLVLISDMQEGSQLDGLQGYDWPRGIEVEVETVQPLKTTNAGVQWVIDTDEVLKTETNSLPRLRVSNSANAKREQFQLRWEGVAGVIPLDVYVPPGQNRTVPAPLWPANSTTNLATNVASNLMGERLVLTGDDDDFDNTVYIVQPKAEQIQVLYVGSEQEKDPAQPLYYLRRAFQQTRRQTVQVASHLPSAPFLASELAGVRLIIASEALPESSVPTLQAFVNDGGTLLFLMKTNTVVETMDRILGVEGLAASEARIPNYAMFGQIDFEHPLFAPFADPRFNDFTKIHFWKYRKLETDKLPGARVLARFDNGDAAFLEMARNKGRLLALVSGWQPSDSQLALSSKFVPLLYAILDSAGGIRSLAGQFHVGDEVNLGSAASGTNAQPVTIRNPAGAEIQLAAGVTNFIQTDVPGVYTVTSVEPPIRFAVNLEAAESRTSVLPTDELERLGVPLKPREIELKKQQDQKRRLHNAELENQQKLWRWLTVAALVVLVMETGLAGWMTRRISIQTEATI